MTGSYEGGGGALPRLLDHIEYTFATDATLSNRQTINLTPVTTGMYVLLFTPKETPSAPQSGYTAYNGVQYNLGPVSEKKGTLVRTDGTVGTDQNLDAFTPNTGVLEIGGAYGTFRTGQVYDIYLFEMA